MLVASRLRGERERDSLCGITLIVKYVVHVRASNARICQLGCSKSLFAKTFLKSVNIDVLSSQANNYVYCCSSERFIVQRNIIISFFVFRDYVVCLFGPRNDVYNFCRSCRFKWYCDLLPTRCELLHNLICSDSLQKQSNWLEGYDLGKLTIIIISRYTSTNLLYL